MVAPGLALVLVRRQLSDRQSAKLSAPDDQRTVEQPALLQIAQQGGDGLVGSITGGLEVGGQRGMIVPDLGVDVELHETHAALHQPSSDQAATAVRIGRFTAHAVHASRVAGLSPDRSRASVAASCMRAASS